MEYGICNVTIVPMRAEPNERSEQVSQLLFGEIFEITELQDKWAKVITAADNYPGWIGRLQFIELTKQVFEKFKQTPAPLTYHAVTQAWKITDNSVMYLPVCSSLVSLTGTTSNIGNESYEIIGQVGEDTRFEEIARSFLNSPYLWGGRTHFGIDCSGFTQAVFKLKRVNLKRDASMQAEQGKVVNSLAESKLGDLVFFDNEEGNITHVGILLNKGEIIHASGRVKIDTIDKKGIYSKELDRYTHKLRLIKRYL